MTVTPTQYFWKNGNRKTALCKLGSPCWYCVSNCSPHKFSFLLNLLDYKKHKLQSHLRIDEIKGLLSILQRLRQFLDFLFQLFFFFGSRLTFHTRDSTLQLCDLEILVTILFMKISFVSSGGNKTAILRHSNYKPSLTWLYMISCCFNVSLSSLPILDFMLRMAALVPVISATLFSSCAGKRNRINDRMDKRMVERKNERWKI